MATELTCYANIGGNSAHDLANYPADYLVIDASNDRLIFTSGSSDIYNGSSYNPPDWQLIVASTWITTSPVIVPYCFVDSQSEDSLQQVTGYGDGDDRYVFCFSFDDVTSTEPTLEAWDTNTHTTADYNVLGSGNNSDSMIHAVCTTDASPGGNWWGTQLAGNNKVYLNNGNGALGSASDLYANVYVRLPANHPSGDITNNPVICIRFTYT